MSESSKRDKILDALQLLLEKKEMKSISISEIAQTAGIGKGSIYYYFESKNDILEALIRRSYQETMETAHRLAENPSINPLTKMAMIFQACRTASNGFTRTSQLSDSSDIVVTSYLHQKYASYLISELKPVLSEIIQQGIDQGITQFDDAESLAEIVLIVLTVKFGNLLSPTSLEQTERTIQALIKLLEKGTGDPEGSLNFLMTF